MRRKETGAVPAGFRFAGDAFAVRCRPLDVLGCPTVNVTGTEGLAVPASKAYEIATAKEVTGVPVIDPNSPYAAKWEVKTSLTEVKLCKKDCGLIIFMR